MEITLKKFQAEFLSSNKRFPAFVAAVGTGKTMMMLLKIWDYCEKYPNSLALIVRKEFTDLRDSTLKDFQTYFGAQADSDKEYHFENGSIIMFRHGAELNVLKNINLSIFGIEQAEEFETDEIFTFLRDRLRRQNAPYRQGCVIANTNGHNWIWRLWKNNPTNEEFDLSEANTFENKDNLPRDFILDLKRMEQDAPNHYRRYVLNSWEEIGADDLLFTYQSLANSIELDLSSIGMIKRILSVDISRYGSNETVFTIVESRGVMKWEQTLLETWNQNTHVEDRLMQIVGKIIDLNFNLHPDIVVVDDDGVGGGVVDRLSELKYRDVVRFQGGAEASEGKKDIYSNKRTESAFILKELIDKGYFKIRDDSETADQLMTLKFLYQSDKRKMLVTKEKMRAEGIKSPDRADVLIMAASCLNLAMDATRQPEKLPRYAIPDNTNLRSIVNPSYQPQTRLPRTAMPSVTPI